MDPWKQLLKMKKGQQNKVHDVGIIIHTTTGNQINSWYMIALIRQDLHKFTQHIGTKKLYNHGHDDLLQVSAAYCLQHDTILHDTDGRRHNLSACHRNRKHLQKYDITIQQ